ncbi:MAG: hypothetical protein K1X83_03445 [Oligoflexia bacterium]|nr:hypothetical protein [Oligoflexia bacterium]
METGLNSFLNVTGRTDPSWEAAAGVVSSRIQIPIHVWQLFRNAWHGAADSKEFMKILGFSKLKPIALLHAANIMPPGSTPSGALIESAIQNLGARLSVAVLSISFVCREVLNSKPPRAWRSTFEKMMTAVEIGYKVGARSFEIGIEGGAMVGFTMYAGHALLMAENGKVYRDWFNTTHGGERSSREIELETFGCEPYQIGAVLLQTLGFGHEMAIGVACAAGNIHPQFMILPPEVKKWQAVYQWIEALRLGRNFPADPDVRNFFPELAPPAPGSSQAKNLTLEVLYTEVAKIRSVGSGWTWHLPKSSYEETSQMLGQ